MSSANSNEKLIEDLTKDLESSSIDSAAQDEESNSPPKPETNAEDEADIIDETSLQDRDALLSDEEKQVLTWGVERVPETNQLPPVNASLQFTGFPQRSIST